MIKRVFLTGIMIVVAISMMAQSLDWNSVVRQAKRGDTKSMYIYSYYSIYGEEYGIKKDYIGAVTMLQKLVAKTPVTDYVIMGYELLGDCYEKGYGVMKHINKAKECWKLAEAYNSNDLQAKIEKYPTSPYVTFVQTVPGANVSFKMVAVKGGTFQMGSNDNEDYDSYSEKPVHRVTLSDYYIGETEVTQELWEAIMGSNPSDYKGLNNPVECVSWYDCQEFIKKLNQLTGKDFRLPTEAEWEYAARGGNKSKGYKYSGSNNVDDVAWAGYAFNKTASETPNPVGSKLPNELGIYDMSGNICEWCADWYGEYSSSPQSNPTGPIEGDGRVIRGGAWVGREQECRVTYRFPNNPSSRNFVPGFRLAICSNHYNSNTSKEVESDKETTTNEKAIKSKDYTKSSTEQSSKSSRRNYNNASKKESTPSYDNRTNTENTNQTYTMVDQKPIYPGGDAALLQWLSMNLQYPEMAQEEGVEGRVYVKFIVEKDGSIGKVEVSRGRHKDLDAEAVRVVKTIPKKFTPAKVDGQVVRSWFTIPVTFKLQK